MRECFHCGKKGHIKRNYWHWNKEQTKEKDKKNNNEKNTAVVVFHKDVMMLSSEEQKCEHVAKNDVEWVVDSAASHHVIPTKGLFTTYKASDFDVVKMGNSSYSKIVGIGDVHQDQCWLHVDIEECVAYSRFRDECVVYIGFGSSGL